jgi:crotonobetainyl-CoA:carnitine CoA-transferase CaiB-like acyl-CoA transferase
MFAVVHRRATGMGQHVDVSQQESIACFLRHQVSYYTYDPEGEYVTRYGDRQKGQARGLGYLPCLDGYVVNGSREGHQWRALLEMVAGEEWEENETLKDALSGEFNLFAFVEKISTFRPVILKWMMKHTREEITDMAQARRIPIVPCNSAEDLFRSPHLAERESFVEIEHPQAGELTYPGAPYQLSVTPWRIDRPAPRLGEHNEEVICGGLGRSREDLERMRESGTI